MVKGILLFVGGVTMMFIGSLAGTLFLKEFGLGETVLYMSLMVVGNALFWKNI